MTTIEPWKKPIHMTAEHLTQAQRATSAEVAA
jgi:hypothetical protein